MEILFLNPEEGRYRSFWRLLFQVLIMAVVVALPVVGLTEAATWLYASGRIPCTPEVFDKIMDVVVGIALTVLVLFSLYIGARYLDHRQFADFGFRMNFSWLKEYFLGLILGSLLMIFIFLTELLAGWITVINYFYSPAPALPLFFAFLYPVIKASCVSVYEEAISRGYLITNIQEGFVDLRGISETQASVIALIVSSTFFGILHLQNPNASMESTFILVVNGAMFATAFVLTRQLAMPIGLHMAWNLFQGFVFGFPVSGDPEIASIIQIEQHGPAWITGGQFGPEGGLLGLGASLVGIVILFSVCSTIRRQPV